MTDIWWHQATWVMMEKPMKVSQRTLDEFYKASKNQDELISKFGNYRPLALNKNPVYASSVKSKSVAKCAMTYEQRKAQQAARDTTTIIAASDGSSAPPNYT